MSLPSHSPHVDPTGTVDLDRPDAVLTAIDDILSLRWPGYRRDILTQAIHDLVRAYQGNYPGLLRCDTYYHDLRHALDGGLAVARLVDGYVLDQDALPLDADIALLAVILGLFHDIGLLRRDEEMAIEGASLTPIHEDRSIDFALVWLLQTPLAYLADKAQLILSTRLTWPLPKSLSPLDYVLSCLIATGDLMCQLADRVYLEKCRDFLFREFEILGLAGNDASSYPTPEALLLNTPSFYSGLFHHRISVDFSGADRFMRLHFGGHCPYSEAIERNFAYLKSVIDSGDFGQLKRSPERIIDTRT